MSGPKDAATSASTFSTAAGTYPTPPLSPPNDHTPRRPLHHIKRLDQDPHGSDSGAEVLRGWDVSVGEVASFHRGRGSQGPGRHADGRLILGAGAEDRLKEEKTGVDVKRRHCELVNGSKRKPCSEEMRW